VKIGKNSVVIGKVPSNLSIGEGSVVVGPTDDRGNTILNQPMAVGFGAKAGLNSISIGAFAGSGLKSPAFPDCINYELTELLLFATQHQNKALLVELKKLSDELKPDKPTRNVVSEAWAGVEKLTQLAGAYDLVTRASIAISKYLSSLEV
jgi:hypothetical protein